MQLKIIAGTIVFITVFVLKGWGTAPQISSSNRKILEALQTAVSSKKLEWLEIVTKQVTEKYDEGDVSDEEFNAIDAIVQKAESGDWKAAQLASFSLSEVQRPTAEDIEMLRDRRRVGEPAKR